MTHWQQELNVNCYLLFFRLRKKNQRRPRGPDEDSEVSVFLCWYLAVVKKQ